MGGNHIVGTLRDAETGFIVSRMGDGFTPEKKKIFLQAAADHVNKYKVWPPIPELCQAAGITLRTFQAHNKEDQSFKAAFQEIKDSLRHHLTQSLAVKANLKQGTLANIAMLRYLEAGTWNQGGLNPANDSAPTKQIITRFNEYINAEVVPDSPQNKQINADLSSNNTPEKTKE